MGRGEKRGGRGGGVPAKTLDVDSNTVARPRLLLLPAQPMGTKGRVRKEGEGKLSSHRQTYARRRESSAGGRENNYKVPIPICVIILLSFFQFVQTAQRAGLKTFSI